MTFHQQYPQNEIQNALDRLRKELTAGVRAGIHAETLATFDKAQKYAPVRHIFYGGRKPNARRQTSEEIHGGEGLGVSQSAARRALGMNSTALYRTFDTGRSKAQSWKNTEEMRNVIGNVEGNAITDRQRLTSRLTNIKTKNGTIFIGYANVEAPHLALQMQHPKALKSLNWRGMFELKSGRAMYHGYLGGRLRNEIQYSVVEKGPAIKGEIWSPTYYAKYMEFGTSHNAAHPFLRPALARARLELRQVVIANMAKAYRNAVAAGMGARRR